MKRPNDSDVWRIAAPLILSNVTVPLLGVVDTAVVGHLDSPVYLGAVAVGSVIFSFLYLGFNFLRMGTTGMVAQAHGADDTGKLRDVLGRGVVSAFVLGLAMIVLQVPIGYIALKLLAPNDAIAPLVGAYFDIRIFSAPAALTNFVIAGWFIGMQNGRGPLLLMLTINLINIALDILFVVGLNMDVRGVALASVIAEYAGVTVGFFLVRRELSRAPGHFDWHALKGWSGYRGFIAVNRFLFERTLLLMSAFAYLTAQGVRQGELILAANAVLINFQYVSAYALDGFANAAEALAGRAYGAGSYTQFRAAVRISLKWSLIVAVAFVAFFYGIGPLLIDGLTDIESVRETAREYLPWLIVLPAVSVWSFLWDGVYVGATRAREMRDLMALSLAAFVVSELLLRPLGNHGLWLAVVVFMAARGLSMHLLARQLFTEPSFPPHSSLPHRQVGEGQGGGDKLRSRR